MKSPAVSNAAKSSEILTFSVSDSRNDLNPLSSALSSIPFLNHLVLFSFVSFSMFSSWFFTNLANPPDTLTIVESPEMGSSSFTTGVWIKTGFLRGTKYTPFSLRISPNSYSTWASL